jgi:hypothetical protein
MIVVIMKKIPCCHCGRYFIPDPRQKNQRYCREKKCQRARKSSWQRGRMKSDPIYRANQKQSQADWLSNNVDYWKRYRAEHPEQADRNRALQKVRNRHHRFRSAVKMDTSEIAKMDASKPGKSSAGSCLPGSFWLVPSIAKMDAIKVYLHLISDR